MPPGTAQLFISLGKSLAQITAQFAPVPALSPLVDSLCAIIQLCENVAVNRHAARQLRDRCHSLVLAMREYQEKSVNDSIAQARDAVLECLNDIQIRMAGWASLGKMQSFVNQDSIAKEIATCHNQVTDCINNFHLTSHFEIHEWMLEFQKNNQLDHYQLLENLSQIQESQSIVEAQTSNTHELVQQMMAMFQKAMGENQQNAQKIHDGLSANLYQYQSQFQELLPDFYLQSGEVKLIGTTPVRGTPSMDIYEGLYLGREKVAIKSIRSIKFDEQSKRRFTREAKIWGQVWKRDRGRHIVPFYGFCQINGPFPCMISPWQKNGDALTYVRNNDFSLNYIRFVTHIVRGVEVLHSMNLVHGDIRSSNIFVGDQGQPLLFDFGLTKVIQDASGAPLTQSSLMADSCRYAAPEVFTEEGVLSSTTDVYSLAMTILEIMTHQQPYRNIKHHFTASCEALKGRHPERPIETEVLRRGLDDKLWDLMVAAWSLDASKRPSLQSFLNL